MPANPIPEVVRALVDKLVDAAYQDGMQELDAMSNETLSARSALEQAIAQQPAAVHEPCAAVAAIQFALTDPEGMTFLRLWNEGEFDTLRREWPDALRKVYDGADPIAQQPAAVDGAYPTPRNRAEAVALARLALAYLGVIDAHIDAAVARCETDLAAQHQEPTT